MLRIFLFIVVLVTIAAPAVKSQNALSIQFNRAMILFESGEYFDAVTEFKRLLFFDSDKKYNFKANMLIGDCYKMGAKFSDAILYYTYAEIAANSNSEVYQARISIIRSNILRRTTARALTLLDILNHDPRFRSKTQEINYWTGWAYIFSDDWKKAAEYFAETDTSNTLAALCTKVDDNKYSVTLANTLSHFIPGSGQFYTGHYFSGLLSIGWNVLWGYVSVNAFIAGRIFDGIMVSNLLWFRFYRGNFENAEKFAEEKNLVITNRALHYLQYNFTGLKP